MVGVMDTTTKRYEVTLRLRYPAWDEKDGIKFEVDAPTKAIAIKRARRQAYDGGHTVGVSARDATFSAKEVE